MIIATTYQAGRIFQHFGHSAQFKFYTVTDGTVTAMKVVDTNGSGHGALAGFLADNHVDVLICGGIGGGAMAALAEAGIRVFGGAAGEADLAVAMYLAGRLDYNPHVTCAHHNHGEEHTCGEHGCGGNCSHH